MSDRSELAKAWLTPEEKQKLRSQAQSEGKSQSDVLREAFRQYVDRDRSARIEGKVDRILGHLEGEGAPSGEPTTHTHKQTGTSETVTKARRIAERIYENHGEVVKGKDVKRAIEDIAGGDPRTRDKYEGILKERDLLFEHPADSAVWTPERDRWASWTEDYVNAMPNLEIDDVLDDYGIDLREYDEIAPTQQ